MNIYFQAAALAAALLVGVSTAQTINEDFKLFPSDGLANDNFGYSIDIANDVIAVGAISDDDNGSGSGSAYLFDASTGAQLFKLIPSDGAADDRLGKSISIDNGVVAIGAHQDDDNGSESGSAYLFDASTGEQLFKLIPNDATTGDLFGWSIAIDNGIVAIGAIHDNDNGLRSGSVYLFDASTGEQLFKLLANDGAVDDLFGWSIAFDNGVVAVGAFHDNDNGNGAGSAYLFDASTGEQLFKLLANDGAAEDQFGWSIGIDNDVVAVGAWADDDNGNQSGSAYLFDASTGEQFAKLLASDGTAGDLFGSSISIANGVVAIGAHKDAENGTGSGSAYLFDASTGEQIAKLLPSDGASTDWFGYSIAIDDGGVAVGAILSDDNGGESGSAYVFDVDPLVLNENQKLTALDGAMGDSFGWSVAIANDVVAVGAWADDDNGNQSGSAFLFNASTGEQLAKLLASDGTTGDLFGSSISIANGVVAVGAWGNDDNGNQSGSAYLFDASTGEQLAKLLASDGAAGDRFGISIDNDNGLVVVGARLDSDNGTDSGSAYLFDASTGEQLFKLLADDGAEFDQFGFSVAIDNGVIAVGARLDSDNGTDSGSAYLFDASTGEQLAKLLASDGTTGDLFGSSISIANGVVAVGAWADDDNGNQSGSVYLFDAFTGEQIAKLLASDGAAGDQFGISIDNDNGVVVVGARGDGDNGNQSGSAYFFDTTTGALIAKLLPSDGLAFDEFGYSIAISNGVVAGGAWGDNDNGSESGSAYVFDTGTGTDETCPADLTGDGVLNFFDVSAFLSAFSAMDPIADFNGDGKFNFFDVSAFLSAFAEGCP